MSIESMYVPASIKNGINLGLSVKLGVEIMKKVAKSQITSSESISGDTMGDAHIANMFRQELQDNIEAGE